MRTGNFLKHYTIYSYSLSVCCEISAESDEIGEIFSAKSDEIGEIFSQQK